MATTKRIIVLDKISNGTTDIYNVAFWFNITSGLQPQTNGSQWVAVAGGSTGASQQENADIQSGAVKEEVAGWPFPTGSPATAVKAILLQGWTNRNAQLNGIGPDQYYGIFDDSVAGWSA